MCRTNRRNPWVSCIAVIAVLLASVPGADAMEIKPGQVTGGLGMGLMGGTPDGTAFALSGHAEQFVNPNLSVGPLAQFALTGNMVLFGVSGQVKYWYEVPNTARRVKLNFQGGLGLVHADVEASDTSWLLPLGAGVDYAMTPRTSLTADFLLNFTNLQNTPTHDAHVMPTFTVGFRF
jgi:hypothetical protein